MFTSLKTQDSENSQGCQVLKILAHCFGEFAPVQGKGKCWRTGHSVKDRQVWQQPGRIPPPQGKRVEICEMQAEESERQGK